MNKYVLIIIGVIAAASVGALVYFTTQPEANNSTIDSSQPDSRVDTSSTDTNIDKSAVDTPPVAATITYTDQGFGPATTTIKKGDSITVLNQSNVNVMLSSADHPAHREQPELNMTTLKPGESGTLTLTKVGTWGYHDHIDETKRGTIVVTE